MTNIRYNNHNNLSNQLQVSIFIFYRVDGVDQVIFNLDRIERRCDECIFERTDQHTFV